MAKRIVAASFLTGSFKLRSGKTSSFYLDKYRFESDPALLAAIAGRDGQRKVIALDGPVALSIAFTAKCPALITKSLAERLYLRDRSGEPLSTKAVIGRVCG